MARRSPARVLFRLFLLLLLLGGAALYAALHFAWLRLPPNLAPWSAVELEAEPGFFARMQINSLASDPPACYAALNRSELEWSRPPERPLSNGCGLVTGARIQQSHVPYSSGVTATCPMVAALYWYEAELRELSRKILSSDLARIEHLGVYACRNVNARETGRRSQHATANAIDIAAFHLEDGRRVSVLEDWENEGAEGRFLAAAHEAACGLFNTVLGPDYNRAHANHFHLDLGRFRICR